MRGCGDPRANPCAPWDREDRIYLPTGSKIGKGAYVVLLPPAAATAAPGSKQSCEGRPGDVLAGACPPLMMCITRACRRRGMR